LVAPAHGQTININLYRASEDDSHVRLKPDQVAGLVPVDGAHWNNIGFPGGDLSGTQCQADQPLSDDQGNADAGRFRSTLTSAYVSYSGANRASGGGGNAGLMGAYLAFDNPDDGEAPDDKGCLTVSGLGAPFTTVGYRVYVYFDCDANNRTFSITLTPTVGQAQTVTGTDSGTFAGKFVQATGAETYANLAEFRDLASSAFTITMDSSFGRGAVNGIQIVSADHILPPTIHSFHVDDGYVEPGKSVTLDWRTAGAERLEISPDLGDVTARSVDGKGSVPVTPSATTTYTLKAVNSGGETTTELLIGVGPPRPNIVYFFIDDMGWQDTSVPFHTEVTPLNKRYCTPNMEKLAAQGMKFTQAYACAVCSPSRVSLMTGLNAARHGVTNWTLRKNRSPDRNHPKIQPPAWNLNGLSAEPGVERTVHAVTLPMLLRNAGYRTIHAGKAHFGAKGTPGENPLNLGFDVNIAGHAAGGPGSYHGKNNFSAAFRKGDRIWDIPGLEQYHGEDVYLNEVLTIEANKAVDQAVADGRPFYLYMSHYAVHAPWEQDDRFLEKYTKMGLKGLPAVFASMIESMDKSLGDIMANLDRLGVADRTIVVFMSDNGGPSQLPRNLPLRGHKITPYEGGTRVPLIVKWPNAVKPGTTCNDYLIIEDIFPTFLDIAGVTKYEQIGGTIDGVSFVPLLKQQPPADPQRPIFWHFPNTYGEPPYSSVRKGDWKLIYHHADRRLELYNLKQDIGEKQNLAAREPEKLREMADTLTDFLRSAKAPMPADKTTGKTVQYPSEVPVRRAADENVRAVGRDHCPDRETSDSDGTMVPSYGYELTRRSP